MHKPESSLDNETHKIIWDFEVHTDQLIPARIRDFVVINKITITSDHRMKIKENGKIEKKLNIARELKKPWNMKVMVIPIVNGALGTVPEGLVRGLEIGESAQTIQNIELLRFYFHSTEKRLRDLRRIVVILTPAKDHWPTLVLKTPREYDNNINNNAIMAYMDIGLELHIYPRPTIERNKYLEETDIP